MDLQRLSALAPFLGQESLERLVKQVITGEVDASMLAYLAPFLSQETLEQLVTRITGRHAGLQPPAISGALFK